MEEVVIATFVLIYTIMAIMTYRIVYSMLLNDLNYEDPKDRELLEDKKAIYLVVGAASLLWFLYIPYMVIMSIIESNKEIHKF